MIVWTIVLLLVILGLLIYYCNWKNESYFKEHGIPHLPSSPLFGDLSDVIFQRSSFIDTLKRSYNTEPKEAKYVGFFNGPVPVLLIRDIELIKFLTVKNFDNFTDHDNILKNQKDLMHKTLFFLQGDQWKKMRTILSPAFTSSKLKTMFNLMFDCGIDFVDSLIALSAKEKDIETNKIFAKYTTDMIATCAFGISVNSMKNPDNEFYTSGTELLKQFASNKIILLRFLPKFIATFMSITPAKIERFFKDIISTAIMTREEKGITRPDMLQLMMDIKNKKSNLSMEEMVAQAFLFFAAGFNTISITACFICHELAVNPDVQSRLQNEIDEVLESCNGAPTYEAISNMEYLNAIIYEVLRFNPVVPMLDRVCVKNIEIPPALPGGKPFVIKEGMLIWIPAVAIHLDPKYFEDPNKFNPDRFIGKKQEFNNSPYYLPFGIGPRMCIGNRFAEMELKVLLFNLLARCDLLVGSKTQVPLKMKKKFAIEPEKGFWLRFEERKNMHPTIQRQKS